MYSATTRCTPLPIPTTKQQTKRIWFCFTGLWVQPVSTSNPKLSTSATSRSRTWSESTCEAKGSPTQTQNSNPFNAFSKPNLRIFSIKTHSTCTRSCGKSACKTAPYSVGPMAPRWPWCWLHWTTRNLKSRQRWWTTWWSGAGRPRTSSRTSTIWRPHEIPPSGKRYTRTATWNARALKSYSATMTSTSMSCRSWSPNTRETLSNWNSTTSPATHSSSTAWKTP